MFPMIQQYTASVHLFAKTSPITRMRRVSVFRNLIPPSQGCRRLRRVYGVILPQMRISTNKSYTVTDKENHG